MKTNEVLQKDVIHAFQWERAIADCNILVLSNNGIITLTGVVNNYTKKTEAENIAIKIDGVKSVVNKINVLLNCWEEKNAIEIKAEILNAFRWNWNTLNDTIAVEVSNGWVTLCGEVEWNYQKEAAKEAVTNLIGVKGVTNTITLKSQKDTIINKTTLRLALQNHLALDSKDIEFVISHSNITLLGSVDSWFQKELAGRIAWKAPGVINVDNELLIQEE